MIDDHPVSSIATQRIIFILNLPLPAFPTRWDPERSGPKVTRAPHASPYLAQHHCIRYGGKHNHLGNLKR